jgi:hypothetical protein
MAPALRQPGGNDTVTRVVDPFTRSEGVPWHAVVDARTVCLGRISVSQISPQLASVLAPSFGHDLLRVTGGAAEEGSSGVAVGRPARSSAGAIVVLPPAVRLGETGASVGVVGRTIARQAEEGPVVVAVQNIARNGRQRRDYFQAVAPGAL